jgi:hypothetical protein
MQKTKTLDAKKKDLSAVKEKFNELKANKIEETKTRIINLRLQVGCGCGGSFDDIHVVVPEDYKGRFSNGDYVDTDDVNFLKQRGYDVYWKKYSGDPSKHDPSKYDRI